MNNSEVIYQDISNRAKVIYEQYQLIIKKNKTEEYEGKKTRLNFSIFEYPKLKGESWYENCVDNIRLSSGTIDNLYYYFHEFAKENTQNTLKIMNISNSDDEIFFEGILHNENDEIRIIDSRNIEKDLATVLDIFASRFILTHEFGHLFNGHCSYINSKGKDKVQFMPTFNYNSSEGLEYISALDYRMLEYDADAFATTDNFKNLILLYSKFEEKVDNKLNIKPIDLFYWWGFAIRSNFLLMQQILKDDDCNSDMKYFPSVLRWASILFIIEHITNPKIIKIKLRDGDTEDKILQKVLAGSNYAEQYYNKKNSMNRNWIAEIEGNSSYFEFLNEVNNNWSDMVKNLKPFSRLPLYNE